MIEKIVEDIYLIKVPLPGSPLKNLNSYFIKGKTRNLLVDTGFNCQECYESLVSGINQINGSLDNTDIFLTHLHTDHVGLSGRISTSDSKIFINSIDETYLKSLYKSEYLDNLIERYLALGFDEKELEENRRSNPMVAYLPSKDTVFTTIDDGYLIELGNFIFKCIITPGHTPGHMCLYDGDKGILLCGDHIIFDITPNIGVWKDIDNSLDDYLSSLKKIKELDAKLTLSAHRAPIGSCNKRIDELLNHHGTRLEEAYNIVKKFVGISPYKVASMMQWSIKVKDWSEFPVIQKWFAVSEATAHLDYLLHKGLLVKEMKGGKFCYRTI